jgi:hypothetical protein
MRAFVFFSVAAVSGLLLSVETGQAMTFPTAYVGLTDLLGKCDKAGGQFFAHADGGYGCATDCKGGHTGPNAGACQVNCDNKGACSGTTPSRVAPRDISSLLRTVTPQVPPRPAR